MTDWLIEHHRGTAAELHALAIPDPPVPSMWVCEPTAPALVLGSAQAHSFAPGKTPGIDVVVRRSGGGAVLLVPDGCTWIDLILPAVHPLWDDDVGRATYWVGDLWVSALRLLGIEGEVHTGAMVRTRWTHLVCFAGLGPGEVLDPSGSKLVGVSQRRTRTAARFQTVAYHRPLVEIAEELGLDDSVVYGLEPADAVDLGHHLSTNTAAVNADHAAVVWALAEQLKSL